MTASAAFDPSITTLRLPAFGHLDMIAGYDSSAKVSLGPLPDFGIRRK